MNMEQAHPKIIIAGLDNAGKTSFLIALRQKYNFYESVRKLKPTIKIAFDSFKFLNKWDISFWDMGGQKKYREIYIKDPVYFEGTDFLYFLIDIQDAERFDIALDYLNTLLQIFEDLYYDKEIVICFHKYDPDLLEDKEHKKEVEILTEKIIEQNPKFKFKFFRTSFYDISSLSKAMSYSLSQLLNLKKINKELKKIAKDHHSEYVYLFTDNGIIISDYIDHTLDSKEFTDFIKSKINEDLIFFQGIKNENLNLIERETNLNEKMEYVRRYVLNTSFGEFNIYLGIIGSKGDIQSLKEASSNLTPLIESSFMNS